jgi:hypothetical protein
MAANDHAKNMLSPEDNKNTIHSDLMVTLPNIIRADLDRKVPVLNWTEFCYQDLALSIRYDETVSTSVKIDLFRDHMNHIKLHQDLWTKLQPTDPLWGLHRLHNKATFLKQLEQNLREMFQIVSWHFGHDSKMLETIDNLCKDFGFKGCCHAITSQGRACKNRTTGVLMCKMHTKKITKVILTHPCVCQDVGNIILSYLLHNDFQL